MIRAQEREMYVGDARAHRLADRVRPVDRLSEACERLFIAALELSNHPEPPLVPGGALGHPAAHDRLNRLFEHLLGGGVGLPEIGRRENLGRVDEAELVTAGTRQRARLLDRRAGADGSSYICIVPSTSRARADVDVSPSSF